MYRNDLDRPVRNRASYMPSSAPETTQSETSVVTPGRAPPTMTRGAVRTRGEAPTAHDIPGIVDYLAGLRQEVRREGQERPLLRLVITRGETPESRAFVDAVRPVLNGDDAFWIALAEGGDEISVPLRTTPLDLRRPSVQQLYKNLVADLVFFPGTGAHEASEVSAWARRTRQIVVAGKQTYTADVQQKAKAAHLGVYCYDMSH